jgi:serine/threonine protein kinase
LRSRLGIGGDTELRSHSGQCRTNLADIVPSLSEPLAPGTLLDGRYRLNALLGQGGMGRVYAALDIQLERKVAVKVMHADAVDTKSIERLFREAKAAARTEHAGVVMVYNFGTDLDLDLPYIVMELLRGEDLALRLMRDGQMSIDLLRRIALDVTDALMAVHEADIVHRDLKPSNIFLAKRRRADEVTILDFGVAKMFSLQALTLTGEIFGTPLYMAPEQLHNSKTVDGRCDLYSLGVVLFECATLELPYDGANPAVLITQHLFAPEPNVRALRPDLPPALADVIMRCLKRDPAERFQSARSVFEALSA